MVMRYDSSDKVSGLMDAAAHIDQLDEPPTCQRMGIMASFNSMEDFEMWVFFNASLTLVLSVSDFFTVTIN